MRRLLGLALALVLCAPRVVLADVAVGNGSVGVPVTAPQGGTGQSSFTTNCVVAATSSSVLGCTATPTISGANFTATSIPNSAFVTSPLPPPTCTTWVPADSSGASLSLTVTSAIYCVVGVAGSNRMVTAQFDVTYPVTASSANAILTLPIAAVATSIFQSGFCAYTTTGVQVGVSMTNSGGLTFINPTTGANLTNVTFSTKRIIGCTVSYISQS